MTRGDKGLPFKYNAAASVRRRVHVTPEFGEGNEAACCAILFYSCGTEFVPAGSPAPGRWTLEEDRAQFLEIADKAIRRNKPTEVIAFYKDADTDGVDLQRLKLWFSVATALERLCVIDRRWSTTGWCRPDAAGA